jgi:hypothetical protein
MHVRLLNDPAGPELVVLRLGLGVQAAQDALELALVELAQVWITCVNCVIIISQMSSQQLMTAPSITTKGAKSSMSGTSDNHRSLGMISRAVPPFGTMSWAIT